MPKHLSDFVIMENVAEEPNSVIPNMRGIVTLDQYRIHFQEPLSARLFASLNPTQRLRGKKTRRVVFSRQSIFSHGIRSPGGFHV